MTGPARDIGKRLRAARQRANVSQAELAGYLEVTQTAVSYWEAGRRLPGIDDLMKIADFLNTPLAGLLPEESERRPLSAVLRAVAEQVDDETLARALELFAEEAAEFPAPDAELTVCAAGARDAAEQLLAAARLRGAPPVGVADLSHRCGERGHDFDSAAMGDGV